MLPKNRKHFGNSYISNNKSPAPPDRLKCWKKLVILALVAICIF